MRIGVLSDTHLRVISKRLERVVEKYFSGTDLLIHAGDFVSYSILSYLEQFKICAVAGNMDSPTIRQTLPSKKIIAVDGYAIGIIHGCGLIPPIENSLLSELPGADVIVYGHTHKAGSHIVNGTLMFNPGSFIGNTMGSKPSIGLLTVSKRKRIQGEIIYL